MTTSFPHAWGKHGRNIAAHMQNSLLGVCPLPLQLLLISKDLFTRYHLLASKAPYSYLYPRTLVVSSQVEIGVPSLCRGQDTAGLQQFRMIKAFQDILIHTRSHIQITCH